MVLLQFMKGELFMQLLIVLLLVTSLGGKSGAIKEIEPIINLLDGGLDLGGILNGGVLDVVNAIVPMENNKTETEKQSAVDLEEYEPVREYPLEVIKNFADENTLNAMANYVALGD